MGNWGEPFIGSEALAAGTVNWHQLRTRYCALFPDVYVQRLARLSLQQRIAAAWLWSHRQATIAGLAAAALHGSKWIDADVPVELVHANARPPTGIITRRDTLPDDEVLILDGRKVTTPERTAFDIGRRGSVMSTVARLDALTNATGFKADDVLRVASRHRGARGLRHLETVLELVDGGPNLRRRARFGCGSSRPASHVPKPRSQCSARTVCHSHSSTWGGTSGCSGLSMKASIIAAGFSSAATSTDSKKCSNSGVLSG